MTIVNYALLSMGATPTAINTHTSGHVNSPLDTSDVTKWVSNTYPLAGTWYQLAWEQELDFSTCTMRQVSGVNYSANIVQVKYSNDGLNWTDGPVLEYATYNEERSLAGVHAKYLRFQAVSGGSQRWMIAQLIVMADVYVAPVEGPDPCDYSLILDNIKSDVVPEAGTWQLSNEPLHPDKIWLFAIYASLKCAISRAEWYANNPTWLPPTGEGDDYTTVLAAIAAQSESNTLRFDGLELQMQLLAAQLAAHDQAIFGDSLVRDITLVQYLANLYNSRSAYLAEVVGGIHSALQNESEEIKTSVNNHASDLASTLILLINSRFNSLTQDWAYTLSTVVSALQDTVGTAKTEVLAAIAALFNPQAKLQEIVEAIGNIDVRDGRFPGLSGITQSNPVFVSGPTILVGPMDGILVTITSIPSGQSQQQCVSRKRYKGLGWVAFISDSGQMESLQQLHGDSIMFRPQDMKSASHCAVFVKMGTLATVTPYLIN